MTTRGALASSLFVTDVPRRTALVCGGPAGDGMTDPGRILTPLPRGADNPITHVHYEGCLADSLFIHCLTSKKIVKKIKIYFDFFCLIWVVILKHVHYEGFKQIHSFSLFKK